MTLDEVRVYPREFLTPAQVASVIGSDPQYLRVAARQCPERLGFNITVIGSRVKIPKIGFIRWMEGKSSEEC